MTKPKTTDWQNRPVEDWTNVTVHEYLKALNKEKYGVDYVPFGKGSIGQRWATERRNIRLELEKKGPEVIKRYVDRCFNAHKFNPKFPTLSWGFMYSYMRNELERAQVDVKKASERRNQAEQSEDIDEDWF